MLALLPFAVCISLRADASLCEQRSTLAPTLPVSCVAVSCSGVTFAEVTARQLGHTVVVPHGA